MTTTHGAQRRKICSGDASVQCNLQPTLKGNLIELSPLTREGPYSKKAKAGQSFTVDARFVVDCRSFRLAADNYANSFAPLADARPSSLSELALEFLAPTYRRREARQLELGTFRPIFWHC